MPPSLDILHTVEFYSPSTGGSQEVVRQISEHLVRRGHSVTVATTRLPERDFSELEGVSIVEFDVHGNAVRGIDGRSSEYLDFVEAGGFDIMMNYSAQMWPTDLVLPGLKDLEMARVFVPCGFSSMHDPRYADYYQRMREWLLDYNACVYLSNSYQDIEFARSCGARNSVVIPNGASRAEFDRVPRVDIRQRLGIPRDHFLLILVGSHTGQKGHEEAIRIFSRARVENATLVIIANDFGRGCGTKCKVLDRVFDLDVRNRVSGKDLIITSLTREETLAAYHEADLFLFPSNIECSPIVLFEAMASRTPFLTTDVGNAAEIVEWSRGGVVMPTLRDDRGLAHADVKGSSELLERLLKDSGWRDDMSERGYRAWTERFTWEAIAERYEDLYLDVVSKRTEGERMLAGASGSRLDRASSR